MRNTIKAVIAGGPPAVLAAGGAVMYLQHELHYLLRPSVIETLAGIGALGGAVLWAKGKGKRKAATAERVEQSAVDERIARLAEAMEQRHAPPRSTQVIDYTTAAQRQAARQV